MDGSENSPCGFMGIEPGSSERAEISPALPAYFLYLSIDALK